MFSLVILVSLYFMVVICIGPLSYVITKLVSLPLWVIYTLAIINIAIGLWWLLLPIPNIRYIGLIDILVGWKLCSDGDKKNS
jgi:hypothetical protein